MSKMIFINLPVADVAASTTFYEAIGATKNPMFSDETASCMVFSDTIHVMILNHEKFQSFTPKAIADSRKTSEVLICISADSREDVDTITENAARAGGKADIRPAQDFGFMYGRSFEDLDGHIWEPMWMDVAGFEAAAASGQMEPA